MEALKSFSRRRGHIKRSLVMPLTPKSSDLLLNSSDFKKHKLLALFAVKSFQRLSHMISRSFLQYFEIVVFVPRQDSLLRLHLYPL